MEGEQCKKGFCECGNVGTCGGNETVAYCDFKNSECKCAENVEACSAGQKCIDEECKGT